MGPSGSGQLTKMVNQICIAGLIQALAEGMNFSKRAGLNTADVMDVITKGAAQSWQMENRWETMLNDEYDFGFAVDLMRKDLDIVLNQAKNLLTKSLAPVNENLADKDYLIGDFSAADLMLGHSCFMANRLGCVSEEMQNIKDYVGRINARAAFQKAITMGE